MKKILSWTVALLLSGMLHAQIGTEYGDAPEGAVAYPRTGVIGQFPTCKTIGPALYIQHNNFGAFFPPSFDYEPDGNGGLCPQFAPYDADECFADSDAGLIFPQPYTIAIPSLRIVTCPNSQGTSLGNTCTIAAWGQGVDIRVNNSMPNATVGYVNVLFDWDANGFWGGASPCPGGQLAPEHVLVNFPIPNPYTGPLSALGPPPFRIGPLQDFVWARFTITERPVPLPWTGDGIYEDGETEDYLIYVGEYDMGDAPEGALAYPPTGVVGTFPTCINAGPAGSFVRHATRPPLLGPLADGENEGNAGLCPLFNPNTYDRDECFQDGDAGLLIPGAYTILGPIGSEVVVPCMGGANRLDTICTLTRWGPEIDILVTGPGYINVLMDWDQSGNWAFNPGSICSGVPVPEHVLVDFPVPAGFAGPLSALNPPPFMAGPKTGFVWSRFTVTDVPIGNPNWNGAGDFVAGETEDYLLELIGSVGVDNPEDGYGQIPFRLWPNPTVDAVQIEFVLYQLEQVRIELFSADGRLISTLEDSARPRGTQSFSLQLPAGLANGMYLVRLRTSSGAGGFERLGVMR